MITYHDIIDPLQPDPLAAGGGGGAPVAWKVTITFKSGRTKVLTDVMTKTEPDAEGKMSILGTNPDGECVYFEYNISNVESTEWQLYSN